MRHLKNEKQLSSRNSSVIPGTSDPRGVGRWAVILAGGEGTRLRPLTRVIAGDDRPKQFCAVLGNETLLDQTRNRVALSVRRTQTIFVLTQHHARFYDPLLDDVPPERLVVQPKNAGTAPAILYSLLRLSQLAPDSSVAFFPSDHYFSDDAAFMAYVESAFSTAHVHEGLVVLLGISPEGPEVDYGWIEPVAPVSYRNPGALRWVRRFCEKPTPELARTLMGRGCLWNSFVMVGRVSAFLGMIRRASPKLFDRFHDLASALNTVDEAVMAARVYSQLDDINFSHEVLAARPGNLAVLPVGGLTWSDMGGPERVLSVMTDTGLGPTVEGFRALAAAKATTR